MLETRLRSHLVTSHRFRTLQTVVGLAVAYGYATLATPMEVFQQIACQLDTETRLTVPPHMCKQSRRMLMPQAQTKLLNAVHGQLLGMAFVSTG
ncbi:hypothetical protein WJX72_006583 [[Myrmecia] bisecta]|uniref:Uncharacterized protein n=1 Tax=[Myrmecia] bisecta TaxID=41462 RepID=A0AAW1PD89_9CHLO